jgi:hypothetical protein
MFGFMMLVVWLWSRDERAGFSGRGWLEAARTSSFDHMVARGPTAAAAAAGRAPGSGGIDDDEHLAAYNAYLAQLNKSTRDSG